ncbi:MAG: hypothetical protein V1779_07060 [bacterium]
MKMQNVTLFFEKSENNFLNDRKTEEQKDGKFILRQAQDDRKREK